MITSQQILLRIQLLVIVSYVIVKFYFRPLILENAHGGVLKIFVLSYPNFCEAVVGTIFITFILLLLNRKLNKNSFRSFEKFIPFLATLFSGGYVILQELKIHNFGGSNTYDINDIIFSIIGLISTFILLQYLQPKTIVSL